MKKSMMILHEKHWRLNRVWGVALVLGCLVTIGEAKLGRGLDIDRMVRDADLICVGTAVDLRVDQITTSKDGRAGYLVCLFLPDFTIKGDQETNTVAVPLQRTPTLSVQEDWRTLFVNKRYLLFLKRGEHGQLWNLVSAEGMMEVGSRRGETATGKDVEARLESAIVNAVGSEDVQVATVAVCFLQQWGRRSEAIDHTLVELTKKGSPGLRGKALAMRITAGDEEALRLIPTCAIGEDAAAEVGTAVSRNKNPEFIPLLLDILRTNAAPALVRQGAMEGLRAMVGKATGYGVELKRAFEVGLDDADMTVKYHALMGLGMITYGVSEHQPYITGTPGKTFKPLPAYEDFMNDPAKYLKMWRPASQKE